MLVRVTMKNKENELKSEYFPRYGEYSDPSISRFSDSVWMLHVTRCMINVLIKQCLLYAKVYRLEQKRLKVEDLTSFEI